MSSTEETTHTRPFAYELWEQADDEDRYWQLMEQHGYTRLAVDANEGSYFAMMPWPDRVARDISESRVVTEMRGNQMVRANRVTGKVETVALICGGRGRSVRCKFCHRGPAELLCDYPTGGKCKLCKGTGTVQTVSPFGTYTTPEKCSGDHGCEGTGQTTCSKRFCRMCGSTGNQGGDYCPDHKARAGAEQKTLTREPCTWLSKQNVPEMEKTECLRASCIEDVRDSRMVLYFQRRRRAMCRACGDEYLSRSK